MAKSIEDVKGIGPASAALLREAGITTADELAGATITAVAVVKGFSEIRAASVIEAAKALFPAEKKTAKPLKKTSKKKKPTKPASKKKAKAGSPKKEKKGGKKKSDKKKTKKKKTDKKGKKKK